jgi:hypothetical protein
VLDDVVFTPESVTVDNLSVLTDSGARLTERRACEISELADTAVRFSLELFSSGMGIYEILSLLSEGLIGIGRGESPSELALSDAYGSFVSAFDRAELATLLVDRLRLAGVSVGASDMLPEVSGDERIIYVKNALADEAYDVLTENFRDPRVSYAKSFKDAVDSVVSGDATYCLLPLEERGGTRLSLVSELIFRHDLRICCITPVFGYEGNADMKYALMALGYSVPELAPDDDGYLEIRIRAEEDGTLAELLSVASYLGISVYRINTLTFDTDGVTDGFHEIVFRSDKGDFTQLLVYLTLFSPAFIPIGMYKNLE